jgi:broad specificity phosphatase PhoE
MRVWALRHGESLANLEGIIVSHPGRLAFEWAGLTKTGREQAEMAGKNPPSAISNPSRVLFVTSDFARAKQTAEIVARAWGASAPIIDERLRERHFGTLEGQTALRYDEVWREDGAQTPSSWQVESPERVAERVSALLADLPSLAAGRTDVVFTAHGDVLQIAQAVCSHTPPHLHRGLAHLENAELRLLRSSGVPH